MHSNKSPILMNVFGYLFRVIKSMSLKITISFLSILTLSGIILISVPACSGTITSAEHANSQSTRFALPGLDKETHGSLDAAYFALG
jgi:hypothetical protein